MRRPTSSTLDVKEKTIEFHPTTAMFPMLDEDELQALAEDIQEFGLLQPIVLDGDERVLDGKNRLRACEIVGVAPIFVTYDGANPNAFVLSLNSRRRNLTKGQLAMIAAKSCSVSEHPDRSGTEHSMPRS